jgi:hypothetical protein
MANLIGGLIALAIALGYVGILAVRVNSLPLWFVVAIGVAMMAWSRQQRLRAHEDHAKFSPSATATTSETSLRSPTRQRPNDTVPVR